MPLLTAPSVGPSATVLARSPLPPAVLLPLVADFPLPSWFTGWAIFPAVTGVDGQEGAWDQVGASRTIRLADRGSVVETIVEFTERHSFAYELTGFTDAFDRFVHGVRGEWSFAPDGSGSIVRWTWEFAPRPGRRLLMSAVLGPLWRVYMQRMIRAGVAEVSRRAAVG